MRRSPQLATLEAIYPRINVTILPRSEVFRNLLETSFCDAAVLPRITYDTYKRNPETCNMHLTQTIFPGAAGWVTNRASPYVPRGADG